MSTIPGRLEGAPDSTSYNVARPLFGRTVASMVNSVNHLAGMRGLRGARSIVDFTGTDLPANGAMNIEPTLRWVVSPLGRYVWWGAFVCPQGVSPVSNAAEIKVYAETPAGVNIDGPIVFNAVNGRLIPTQYYTHAVDPEFGASAGRDHLIHSGWMVSTTAGTAPRLLDVDGYQGLDIQIRVESVDCRINSHWAREAYQPTI